MGWGRMLLLGDVGQQLDIRDTQRALAQIGARLHAGGKFDAHVADELEALTRENGELKLYLAAVVRLLLAKGVVTQAELEDIVKTIDRSDGSADGRFDGDVVP